MRLKLALRLSVGSGAAVAGVTSYDVCYIEEGPSPVEDIGMEYLLHPEKEESELLSAHEGSRSPNRDITDIAAAAQSLQPTGYTLETTVVSCLVATNVC